MRRIGTGLVPWAVLMALGVGCFARLIADPSGLIATVVVPASISPTVAMPVRSVTMSLSSFFPIISMWRRFSVEFGHWPLDCTGFGGRPIIGNPQSGVFYPPVWRTTRSLPVPRRWAG